MNKLGISSSCYYPEPTEAAFEKICRAGVRTAEVFYNSPAELTPEFSRMMYSMQQSSGVDVVSVHTYTGFMDSFNLFTDYERRFYDGLEIYKRLAETATGYGAKYVVMHGAKTYHTVSDKEMGERFNRLAAAVAAEGAMLCYENVNNLRSADPNFLLYMLNAAEGKAGAVLDIKQARRTGIPYTRYINLLGGYIKHVHISDYNDKYDCITPLTGKFRFGEFFRKMNEIDYGGAYIIELYRHSYKTEDDITNSHNLLIEKYNNLW